MMRESHGRNRVLEERREREERRRKRESTSPTPEEVMWRVWTERVKDESKWDKSSPEDRAVGKTYQTPTTHHVRCGCGVCQPVEVSEFTTNPSHLERGSLPDRRSEFLMSVPKSGMRKSSALDRLR